MKKSSCFLLITLLHMCHAGKILAAKRTDDLAEWLQRDTGGDDVKTQSEAVKNSNTAKSSLQSAAIMSLVQEVKPEVVGLNQNPELTNASQAEIETGAVTYIPKQPITMRQHLLILAHSLVVSVGVGVIIGGVTGIGCGFYSR